MAASRVALRSWTEIGRKPESGKVRSSFLRALRSWKEIGRKPESRKVRSSFPRGTAKLARDRAKGREQEQRKVEKKKRKQVITCELEWDMMFIN